MRKGILSLFFVLSLGLFWGCQSSPKKIKVAASTHPHAEILKEVQGDLKKDGVTLEIVEVDDYALPNRLLEEEVVDANFFQHIPYLEAEKRNFGYDLNWIAKVHIEPLAIYSEKIDSLSQLADHATVAVPSDPSNETRALRLLEQKGLLTLRGSASDAFLTILDIKSNPKKLKIQEIDAALLPHLLKDVDIAVIAGNYALQANLDLKEALAFESKDSAYVNVLVIRSGEEHREELLQLAKLLNSEKIRLFIEENYKDRLKPAF